RPCAAHQAPHCMSGRARLPTAALRGRRAAHPERAEGTRAAPVRGESRSRRRARKDDRVVPGTDARIRLAWPDVGQDELAEVADVLASGQLTMGPKVAELESEIARACEVEHAAVSS